jgi:hypothetical protein
MLHSSGHRAQKPIRKFNHLPHILGVKRGGGMDKMRKQGANVRIFQPMLEESRPYCSPDIDTHSLRCMPTCSMPSFTPKHDGKSWNCIKTPTTARSYIEKIDGQRIKHTLCLRESRSETPSETSTIFTPNFIFFCAKKNSRCTTWYYNIFLQQRVFHWTR